MATKLVIVESPAKAKTINKYLGKDFQVLASFGHVRDLPPKDGSVDPDNDFAMAWHQDARGKKSMKPILDAAKASTDIYLASDPDREGEAIAWHVADLLEKKKLLKDRTLHRVTFNEITKSAVKHAIDNPRTLDNDLIEAYLARRALDYLVGFTLSPILWRKLPGAKSAGRVQSVALRLVCEREAEIEAFVAEEYWTVDVSFLNQNKEIVPAKLTHFDGKKLDKLSLGDETIAMKAKAAIEAGSFSISSIEQKQVKRNPAAPFTTSTLQQAAGGRLYFSASRTMQVAQKLYEGIDLGGETVGLITYMRTDGTYLSGEAIAGARSQIENMFGASYVPSSPRQYKTKAKNAQEAHEAIRPTDLSRTPDKIKNRLSDEEFKLYELIWKRTMASQMEAARFDQVTADIKDESGTITCRASGSVLAFDGFTKLYRTNDKETDNRLPKLEQGEALTIPDKPVVFDKEDKPIDPVNAAQHFTQPPPRYSEASLVKKMEELGIGRPSTYASILRTLNDRGYVANENRRLTPEDRGRLVTSFLTEFFPRYVAYEFTANLEEQLDDISGGRLNWKKVLSEFWDAFSKRINETKELRITEVIDALNVTLAALFFPPREDGSDPRSCPKCDDGQLSLKLGKFGSFIGCSNYPECNYTRKLGNDEEADEAEAALDDGPKMLGVDPETGKDITLRKGPYGFYVQLGEAEKGKKGKPKRAGLPKGKSPADFTFEEAVDLLALPRVIGKHPEDGEEITAGIGRFGPYVKHGSTFASLSKDDDVLTVGINRAVVLIAEKKEKGPGRGGRKAPAGKEVGKHPKDDKPITYHTGRYGPYVKHGKTMASVPKGTEEGDVTAEKAVEWLDAKAAGKATGKGKKKKSA